MANNIRKYLEYGFFILLNIGLLIPFYTLLLYVAIPIAILISNKIFNVPLYLITSFEDPTVFLTYVILLFLIFSFKPLIFIAIYLLKKTFPNIHFLLTNLRKNHKITQATIILSFLMDILFYFIFQYIIVLKFEYFLNFLPISLCFGLTSNYLIFLLFFPPIGTNNIISKRIKFLINFMRLLIEIIIISAFFLGLILLLVLMIIF